MLFGREPVLWSAALKAVLLLAIAFGVTISDVQMAAVAVAADGLLALLVRPQVTPLIGGDPGAVVTGRHVRGDGDGLT